MNLLGVIFVFRRRHPFGILGFWFPLSSLLQLLPISVLFLTLFVGAFCAPGLEGYIETLQGLWKKAKDAGSTIDNAGFIVILLNLFPESWDNITTPLYKQEDLTIIITNLTTHGKQLITDQLRKVG